MRRWLGLVLLLLAWPLAAQETVVTGLSTDKIALTVNYDGSEILVFGAVRREGSTDPEAGPLDVIITLKGPGKNVTIRRKERRFGIWINTESVGVRRPPSYYAVAATGPLAEILTETERLRYGIGMDQAVREVETNGLVLDPESFLDAMVRLRKKHGLYALNEGGVTFAQETLFQTRFHLPANLVEGDYAAEFFLVRDRKVISMVESTVSVEKTGIERWLFNLSRRQPFLYGLLAVAIALAAGWLANTAFRMVRR